MPSGKYYLEKPTKLIFVMLKLAYNAGWGTDSAPTLIGAKP